MADIFLFNFYESKQLSLDKVDVSWSAKHLMNELVFTGVCVINPPADLAVSADTHRVYNTKSITKYNLTVELRAVTVAAALL